MLDITAYSSLFIQLVTGIIDVFGLTIDVSKDKILFKDLLKVELMVQLIEFVFYIWMVSNIYNIKNITPYRYFDWFITTPIMLITFMAYLDSNPYNDLYDYVVNNSSMIMNVVLLNMSMLLFGLMGELRYITYNVGIILGFIPFFYYFKMIYDKYIKDKEITNDKNNVFWFFLIVWSIYGIAAFMPYTVKNIMYNILDLFAKNGFGVFLVYILWTNRVEK
jgi:bacteriorhodopsin